MAAIFISYRKQGADMGHALHLAEDLRAAFGHEAVFLDEQTYTLGPISTVLSDELLDARAIIVVIGQVWLDRREDLKHTKDWVRLEIEAGLQRNSLLVPVLVDDAHVPPKSQLPVSVAGLQEFRPISIYARHWKENVDALIDALASHLGLARARTSLKVPNLSGDWIDTDGVQVKLVHRGSDIKVYLLSGGRPMGEGDATLDGNEVRLSIWRPDLGSGSGTGTVSPDGRQVSGAIRYGSQRYGFSISRR
jgi:hypothetical protein